VDPDRGPERLLPDLDHCRPLFITLLGETVFNAPPDGVTSPDGVQGVGSGKGYGEPPGAKSSTIADILSRAASELEHGAKSGEPQDNRCDTGPS